MNLKLFQKGKSRYINSHWLSAHFAGNKSQTKTKEFEWELDQSSETGQTWKKSQDNNKLLNNHSCLMVPVTERSQKKPYHKQDNQEKQWLKTEKNQRIKPKILAKNRTWSIPEIMTGSLLKSLEYETLSSLSNHSSQLSRSTSTGIGNEDGNEIRSPAPSLTTASSSKEKYSDVVHLWTAAAFFPMSSRPKKEISARTTMATRSATVPDHRLRWWFWDGTRIGGSSALDAGDAAEQEKDRSWGGLQWISPMVRG